MNVSGHFQDWKCPFTRINETARAEVNQKRVGHWILSGEFHNEKLWVGKRYFHHIEKYEWESRANLIQLVIFHYFRVCRGYFSHYLTMRVLQKNLKTKKNPAKFTISLYIKQSSNPSTGFFSKTAARIELKLDPNFLQALWMVLKKFSLTSEVNIKVKNARESFSVLTQKLLNRLSWNFAQILFRPIIWCW